MSVRMRHTRAHTANRRSHHALSEPRLSQCTHCKEPHTRHQMCENCGYYRGRLIVDVQAKMAKREAKFAKRKEELASAAGGSAPVAADASEKDKEGTEEDKKETSSGPLSMQELSKKQ